MLGWRPLVKSWLNTRPESFGDALKKRINHLFDIFVDPCIQLVRRKTRVNLEVLCLSIFLAFKVI